MRTAATVFAIALLTSACQSENELRYVSTLDAETRGVMFSKDGNESHVGMSGMTCTVSTEWGCPTDDADLPTSREIVLDHFDGKTLASTEGAIHQIDGAGWDRNADVAIAGVRTARYTARGILAIRGDDSSCQVELGSVITDLPTSLCAEGLEVDVDRERGVFYTATGTGVFAVDQAGAQRISASGDLVAWDPVLKHLYVATTGQGTISAVKRNGKEVWTKDLGLPIRDIATRGDKSQVLVLADDDEAGLGVMYRMDGKNGKVKGESAMPDANAGVVVSDNGLTVGLIRPTEVHFFALVLPDEGEEDAPEEDPKDCLSDERISAD